MRNGSWDPDFLTIDRSVPFEPTTIFAPIETGEHFTIADQDKSSLILSRIDLKQCFFENFLGGEHRISGEQRLSVVTGAGRIRLDAQVGQILLAQSHPILKGWAPSYRIFFDATRMLSPIKRKRCVPYLFYHPTEGSWQWRCHYLADPFRTNDVSLMYNIASDAIVF